jgi:O-antigen/teichoic acid export membrane protein
MYASTALGFAATVAAARILGVEDFGLFALVVATTGFLQLLLDSTVDEALIKFGIRYAEHEQWGRFRRLFRVGSLVKLAGGAAAALAVVLVAPVADTLFGAEDLAVPLLIAAALPLVQAPESVAGAVLVVRGRYDLRGAFMALAMGLRLAGVAIGSLYGVAGAVLGMVVAQAIASAAIVVAGRIAFGRFPRVPHARLAEERGMLRRFVAWAAVGSGLASGRTTLSVVLAGIATSPAQAGFFRSAQAPQTAFAAFSAPARLVLLTEQTKDFEGGRLGRVFGLIGRYMAGTAALMAVVVPVLWWLMEDVLRLLYGADYVPAAAAARLILLAAAVQLVWGWTKLFPVSIGRPELRVYAHAVELAVLAPLVLVLGAEWGAQGAAGGVLAATVAYALLWTVVLFRLRRSPLAPAAPPREAFVP